MKQAKERYPVKIFAYCSDGWDRYVDEPMTEKEMEKLRQAVNRQSPYGSHEWQVQICKEPELESTIRPRGRPKKEKGND